MNEEQKVNESQDEVENVEIAPLTDEDLDGVAGGSLGKTIAPDCTNCADTSGCCTSGA
jgi:hypothetical protein